MWYGHEGRAYIGDLIISLFLEEVGRGKPRGSRPALLRRKRSQLCTKQSKLLLRQTMPHRMSVSLLRPSPTNRPLPHKCPTTSRRSLKHHR